MSLLCSLILHICTTISTAVSRNLVAFGLWVKSSMEFLHMGAFGGIRYGRSPNLADSRVLLALGIQRPYRLPMPDSPTFQARRAGPQGPGSSIVSGRQSSTIYASIPFNLRNNIQIQHVRVIFKLYYNLAMLNHGQVDQKRSYSFNCSDTPAQFRWYSFSMRIFPCDSGTIKGPP